MIRWAIYLFVAVSLYNFGQKILAYDLGHLGVAAVLVFMSVAAAMLTLED